MFAAVVRGMGNLLAYFYDLIPNYGVGIILLTITVRLAMIPLAVKQAHLMIGQRANAAKMKKLQPEFKKLKDKHKDDRAKLYEEQKKLYDQHDINMLGSLSGCLPMLLQMPIFMAMYQVLSGCNKIFGAGRQCRPAFFIPESSDLHQAIVNAKATFLSMNLTLRPSDVFKSGGLVEAWPFYLLCAFMGLTMWYQTKQMAAAQPLDPQMAQTQKIMQLMPLLLLFASVNFPIGLTLYWSATNVWTIGQQFVLLKKFGPDSPLALKGAPSPKTALVEPAPRSDPSTSSANGKVKKPLTTRDSNGKVPQESNSSPSRRPKGSGARKKKKKKKGGRR